MEDPTFIERPFLAAEEILDGRIALAAFRTGFLGKTLLFDG
jgi:hypothetical protein